MCSSDLPPSRLKMPYQMIIFCLKCYLLRKLVAALEVLTYMPPWAVDREFEKKIYSAWDPCGGCATVNCSLPVDVFVEPVSQSVSQSFDQSSISESVFFISYLSYLFINSCFFFLTYYFYLTSFLINASSSSSSS